MRRILLLTVAISALGFASRLTAADSPLSPKVAAGKMAVPPGFKVTLFAGEPDVVQPIAFTFDDRGRMWVVECVMYPKWSQDGKNGKDRVVILEDVDGDGVHDKKTVVLDDGVNLSGIELGFGGMYLCSSPNLLYVPIKDDKPTGKSEVLLDGWNIKDAKHNIFNSLGWGPDGWLYGCNGIQTKSYVGKPGTPQNDRTFFDCGVWRFHPTKRVFEVFANGTTNPFGLDWDDHGELYITNCVIDHLFHFVPGGHYQRMYGQDPNPLVTDAMKSCVDYKHWGSGGWTDSRADQKTGALKKEHDDAGGGHAHSGCAIYLGDNFPAEYRNTLFTSNIHGNRLNNDGLARTPGGMKGVRRPDFLFANDPWFRGICVKQGPDGGLYVSDWSDTGECHNYVVADISNGRIYRTIYGDQKGWKGDVSKMTDAELVKLQTSKNEWLVRKARRVLQERAAAGRIGQDTVDGLQAIWAQSEDAPTKLRAAWTLHCIGRLTAEDHVKLCRDPNEHLRAWGLTLALEDRTPSPSLVGQIEAMLKADQSTFVRSRIASAVQRFKFDLLQAFTPLLCVRPEDAEDAKLTLMYWYTISPVIAASPQWALGLVESSKIPFIREASIRLYLTLPHKDMEGAMIQLRHTLAIADQHPDRPAKLDVLRGMKAALEHRRDLKPDDKWVELLAGFRKGGTTEVAALADELSLKFGDEKLIASMKERITQKENSSADRSRAIELLAARKTAGLGETLRGALTIPEVRRAAIRGLANYPEDATPAAILSHYGTFTAAEKADAIQTLTSRPKFALALLEALEKGTVPKADVSAFTARQILALNDKAVSTRLNSVWGTVQPASQTRAAQTAKFKALITPESLKSANVANGRKVFEKSCVACHKLFGQGGDVGPELTGSQRTSLDYLLENVLDPSAAVPNEYKMTTFNLADGRVLSGIIRRQSPQAITIRTLTEEVTVPVGDIESKKQTPLSIMPDGLFDTLKDDEVRDLVAYLAISK